MEGDYTPQMKSFCRQLPNEIDVFKFIQSQIAKNKITEDDLLRMIVDNPNLIDYHTIRQCVENDILTEEELKDKGISPAFVDMLYEKQEDVLPEEGQIDSISAGTTEIYFWGIPTSGKTCALGTILSAARKGQAIKSVRATCEGKDLYYYHTLRQIFDKANGYCILPGRTAVDTNFAIQTVMTDWKKKKHPITLIEMAGELFCAMAWKKQKRDSLLTDKRKKAIEEFENILVSHRSENPKYHFFIIEYNKQDRLYEGQSQDTYLEIGLQNLIDNKVLDKDKDKAFIIVTKTDMVQYDLPDGQDPYAFIDEYLQDRYENFYNLIEGHCGKLPQVILFSIGEVCFQHLCHVNLQHANIVLNKLMELSAPHSLKFWKS